MPKKKFNCADNDHKEGDEYPNHPCWGWMKTHTYEFDVKAPLIVGGVSGRLKAGMWGTNPKNIQVQISKDGKEWTTVGTVEDVPTTETKDFTVEFKPQLAKWLRFKAVSGYVDTSKGEIWYGITGFFGLLPFAKVRGTLSNIKRNIFSKEKVSVERKQAAQSR